MARRNNQQAFVEQVGFCVEPEILDRWEQEEQEFQEELFLADEAFQHGVTDDAGDLLPDGWEKFLKTNPSEYLIEGFKRVVQGLGEVESPVGVDCNVRRSAVLFR